MRIYAVTNLVLLLLIAVLCSCNQEDKGVQEIDLTDLSRGRILLLNELMEDIRVVSLETNENSLVPRYYQSFIGEKYILIMSNDNILQFDSEGKFIRSIGQKGKGPGEFSGISDYAVSVDEAKLYTYFYGRDDHLLVFDLSNGKPLSAIKLPFSGLANFTLAENHILAVCNRSSTRELYTLSYEGELIDTLSNIYQTKSRSYSGRGQYLKNIDNKIYYLGIDTDSLFIMDGVKKSAAAYYKVNNRYDNDKAISGNSLMYSMQTVETSLLTLVDMKIEKNGQSISTWIEGEKFLLLDNQSGKVEPLSGFYHDYFEMEVDELPIGNMGSLCYLKYSAIEFKDLLSKALENMDLDNELAKKFRELDAHISEEDNPVYLVSKSK